MIVGIQTNLLTESNFSETNVNYEMSAATSKIV